MKDAIYDKGKINQIVVLDNISMSKSDNDVLSTYVQPAFFVLKSVKFTSYIDRDDEHMYTLEDSLGSMFDVSVSKFGWYLRDINSWATDKKLQHEQIVTSMQRKIVSLKDQIEILKEVIIEIKK